MPTEPYKAYPTVEPAATPPHDYFQLQANPERFAAAAKGLEQFGGEVSKAADLWGQLQVDAQANSTLKAGDDLLNQLRTLHGQEQIDFANNLPERLNQVITQGGQGLSPVQRNRFENIVRPYQYRLWNGETATSQARAASEVAHQTYENTVTEAGDRAARFSNNPEGDDFKHAVADSVYAYQQLERFKGNENLPGTMENAERQGKLYAYKRAAEAMSIRDPVAAMKFTDDHKEELGAAYTQLAKEFHNKAEVMQSETRGDISQKANGIADPIAREGYLRAHANDLGPELFKSLMEQTPGVKPSGPSSTPSDFVKQQIQQETQKPPGQPAQQPAQPTPQKPRAQIEVPLDGHIAMLSLSRAGRAQLIEEAIKQYPPNSTIVVSGRKFPIPAGGTTFEIEGIKHTVPIPKTAAEAPKPATPATAVQPTAPQQNAAPAKSSQNFSPVQQFSGATQSTENAPGQKAINTALNYAPTMGGYANKLGGLEPGEKPPAPGITDREAVSRATTDAPTTPGAVTDLSAVSGIRAGHPMQAVNGMIIHHSGGGGTVQGVIDTLKERGLSAQFVIDRNGKTYQLIPDGTEAHHIMNGWGPKGEGKSNRNMQGVEVIARDNRDVTPVQIKAVQALVARQAAKYGYDPATSVYGHGEVNPGHKEADEGMSSVNLIRGQTQQAAQ